MARMVDDIFQCGWRKRDGGTKCSLNLCYRHMLTLHSRISTSYDLLDLDSMSTGTDIVLTPHQLGMMSMEAALICYSACHTRTSSPSPSFSRPLQAKGHGIRRETSVLHKLTRQ